MCGSIRSLVLAAVLLLSLPAATGSVVAAGGDAGAATGADGPADGPVVVIDDRTDRVRVLDGDGDVLAAGDIDETAAVLRESGRFTDAEVERTTALAADAGAASDPIPSTNYQVSCSGLGCRYEVESFLLFAVPGGGYVYTDGAVSGSDASASTSVYFIRSFSEPEGVVVYLTADADDVYADGGATGCVQGDCTSVG